MIAIYARQSIEKKDSISIESQVDFCIREIGNEEKYQTYIDEGFSGSNIKRPEFKKMIKDVKSGIITKVVVYKLDRISRSILDFSLIIELFKKHNVGFLSSQEKFDTSTPMGNAMLNITMIFAQLERETIQQRIKDNYYSRGKKGFYLGGRAPYGFNKIETKVNNKKTYTLSPNEEQSMVLNQIYEFYSEPNMSLGKISKKLNALNIPAPKGGKWDSCKLSRIMRNPVYVKANTDVYLYYQARGCTMSNDIVDFTGINGCYLYGKREANERKYTNVEDHTVSIALHEGLIDSDLFLTCQHKLDKNVQIKNTGKGKYTWLSGLIKCENCGYSVSVSKNVMGTKYLICRGKHGVNSCDGLGRVITVEELEPLIESQLLKKVANNKHLIYKKTKVNKSKENECKIKIASIENKIENLIDKIAESNDITVEYLNKKILDLTKEKNEILEQMRLSEAEDSEVKTIQMYELIDKWHELNMEDRKVIVKFFIKKVSLNQDDVFIEWTERLM